MGMWSLLAFLVLLVFVFFGFRHRYISKRGSNYTPKKDRNR